MSISRFQERFLNGGCAKVILGSTALVFVIGLIYTSFGGSPNGATSDEMRPAALTVGNVQIPPQQVEDIIQRSTQQQLGGMAPPVDQLASMTAGALDNVVREASIMYLAQQNGVNFNDQAAVKAALIKGLDDQIEMMRFQLQMQGKAKTEKEFEEEVKKQSGGRTIATIKEEAAKNIDEALNDPAKKTEAEIGAAQQLLLEQYQKKAAITEDIVKAGYTNFETKRILLKDADATKGDQILADIKTGKLKFEQAIDKFSRDLPPPKKKLSEVTNTLSGAMLQGSDDYQGLRNLKQGEVSGVLSLPEGKAIYKVVKVTLSLPTDYDKNKQKYLTQAAQGAAQKALMADLKKVQDGGLIKWNSPGYAALYSYGQVLQDQTLYTDEAKRMTRLKAVVEEAKKAIAAGDTRTAALAQYAAFSGIWSAPGADKKALAAERVQVIGDVLQATESPMLRLELVDLYIDQKNAEEAFGQLLQTSQNNNDYERIGQQTWRDIETRILKMEQAKMLTPDMSKQIREEQARWKTEEKQFAKDRAESARLEAEQRKKAEADLKADKAKFEAEQKKNAPKKP